MNGKTFTTSGYVLKRMLVILIVGCLAVGWMPFSAQAASFKLNKTKANMYTGSVIQLKAKGTKSKVQWISNNTFVATVTGKGKVTAKNAGTAYITAKAGKKSAACKVTVKDITVKLSDKNLTLREGETKTLTPAITPADYGNKNLIWKSSNESVVTVTKDGELTAVGVGMATVTVKCGSQKDSCTVEVNNKVFDATDAGQNFKVEAEGEYRNWDGVSNVAQFADNNGEYCFAYNAGKYVYIVKTRNGAVGKDTIRLKKEYNLFGGVACDSEGNYYLVTGQANDTDDTAKNTIFVSKYDKYGTLIKTAGDNGSSSLADYYGSKFYTRIPFDGGNCDVAINGKILAVHYAREMYSGHQSNSVFAINTDTMEKVQIGSVYQSHCFAQRVIPYKDGFVFAGEGDCFDRAFTVTFANPLSRENIENNIFHFWVAKGTYDKWDMHTLNNNFAHMGGLAMVDDTNVVFAGTSVKALSSKALNQNEQLFVQIFDPAKKLSSDTSYVTKGTRSGLSGKNGDEAVTDYGVEWLSNFGKNTEVFHPQVVSDGKGTIVVLFEKYVNESYRGVYCIKLNKDGVAAESETCLSANAYLNPCRMPVYSNGKIYWTANKYKDVGDKVYVFSVDI